MTRSFPNCVRLRGFNLKEPPGSAQSVSHLQLVASSTENCEDGGAAGRFALRQRESSALPGECYQDFQGRAVDESDTSLLEVLCVKQFCLYKVVLV